MYNISKYLEDHPGGVPVLVEVAGQDATAAFEDVGHSDEARDLLEPFLIGELPSDVSDTTFLLPTVSFARKRNSRFMPVLGTIRSG